MNAKLYWKVEMLNAFDPWVDAEWTNDDKPMTFASQAEAEAEIDDHIAEVRHGSEPLPPLTGSLTGRKTDA